MQSIIDYKLIGSRIKNKRNELGFTQERVSREANITSFYLSKIENGKSTPTLEILATLAKVLKMDLSYLISGSSKLESSYIDNRFNEICNSATDEQIELIIKISKAILDE